jgi:hypothetical protein
MKQNIVFSPLMTSHPLHEKVEVQNVSQPPQCYCHEHEFGDSNKGGRGCHAYTLNRFQIMDVVLYLEGLDILSLDLRTFSVRHHVFEIEM